jgi:hypothetical protein
MSTTGKTHLQVESARLYSGGLSTQTKGGLRYGTGTTRAEHKRRTDDFISKKTPAAKVRHGKVEIAIWPNDGANGTFYTASAPTICYQDEKGDFKDGGSFGRHDLLDLPEAARETATKIRDLSKAKAEGQNR